MNFLRKISRRVCALFRPEKLDADMAEEMRAHLERRTQANLAAGLSADEARYAAQRSFGGMDQLKEVAREQRGWMWLGELMRDARFALRQLAKSRGFTAIAVLTLALGIGVNTSMFSVLNTLLFHTPPYPEPAELIRVFRTGPTFTEGTLSPTNFLDFRAQAHSFRQLAAFRNNSYSLALPDQPAEQLRGYDVTGDFFAGIGVQPALGRWIGAEEDQPGRDQVVVLSDAAWRKHFAADPAILNREIRLDGRLVTVIGVMPAGFDDPLLWGPVAAWRPLAFDAQVRAERGSNYLEVLGRLNPGGSAVNALAEMNLIAANLARAHPGTNARNGIALAPLVRSMQDKTTRLLAWFAMGLAACVLLIACANLANLLFARNALRAREHAIRAALGASRLHLIRLALTESILLALAGGAGGLLLAAGCNRVLGARLALAGQSGLALPLDWSVLAFASVVAMGTGLAFGLLPALFASRTDLNAALKQGGRGNTSAAHHRLRHALIVGEVALALVLLSGAGFSIRGLERFLTRDHGWRTGNLLTAYFTLSPGKYSQPAEIVAFYDRLRARLGALPGVERVAFSRTLPFSDFGFGQRFVVEGRPVPAAGDERARDVNSVSADYFDTLGLTLVAGRTFHASDLQGPARLVINETMARQYWPGETAVGKRIRHPSSQDWQEIIGVVRNVSFATNLETATSPFQSYRWLAREPARGFAVSLRTSIAPAALIDAVRRVVAEIDPAQPVNDIRSADQAIERGLANFALTSRLLAGFALLGLLLAAIGLYGVISGWVGQRTHEIGIRMALGAQIRDVLRLVLGHGFRFVFLGIGLGLAGALVVARVLASWVPALPGAEVATTVGVTVVLLAVAAVACLLPAGRAARLNPLTALRAE